MRVCVCVGGGGTFSILQRYVMVDSACIFYKNIQINFFFPIYLQRSEVITTHMQHRILYATPYEPAVRLRS